MVTHWDWRLPHRPNAKNKWQYKRICERLNSQRRPPNAWEMDVIIDYCYPEEERILWAEEMRQKYEADRTFD